MTVEEQYRTTPIIIVRHRRRKRIPQQPSRLLLHEWPRDLLLNDIVSQRSCREQRKRCAMGNLALGNKKVKFILCSITPQVNADDWY